MKEINIAKTIAAKRREKGITQDELAAYMGVSKASVSKWETGQSYPDITFLPQLAAYFAISIDDLMGYAPQMTAEDIRVLYRRMSADFVSRPFEQVVEDIRATAKKYYGCFPLLYNLGLLLLNHHMLAPSPELTAELLLEAIDLFLRVRKESEDVELARNALHLEVMCHITLGRAEEALALLETDALAVSTEPLFAAAYHQLGRKQEATAVLQRGVYQAVISLSELLAEYTGYAADVDQLAQTYARAMALGEAFALPRLHPATLLKCHVMAAYAFCALGDVEGTLDALERYASLATSGIFPLKLQGDDFFNALDPLLETYDLPRDQETVRRAFVDAVTAYPAFAALQEEPRYRQIISTLRTLYNQEG